MGNMKESEKKSGIILKGIGGFYFSNSEFIVSLDASISGNVITMKGCYGVNHTASASHSITYAYAITAITGLL